MEEISRLMSQATLQGVFEQGLRIVLAGIESELLLNRRPPLAMIALLALAGCGSTVPVDTGQITADGSINGLQTTAPLDSANTTIAGGTTGTIAPGGVVGSGSSATDAAATSGAAGAGPRGTTDYSASGGTPSSATNTSNVPGVTATTVKLGVEYIDAAALNAYATAAGANGTGGIDGLAAYKAAVGAVNRGGGAGGRKIEIVPYKRSISDNNAQVAQAECAAWTEDNHVFAATAYVTQGSKRAACPSGGCSLWLEPHRSRQPDRLRALRPLLRRPRGRGHHRRCQDLRQRPCPPGFPHAKEQRRPALVRLPRLPRGARQRHHPRAEGRGHPTEGRVQGDLQRQPGRPGTNRRARCRTRRCDSAATTSTASSRWTTRARWSSSS